VWGLEVIERTPDEHDKQMAYVQGLTHFIGRAIKEIDIPQSDQTTSAYKHLLAIKEMLGYDSHELFLSIEKDNPYTKEVREKFVKKIKEIDSRILNEINPLNL